MKRIIIILLAAAFLTACRSQRKAAKKNVKEKVAIAPEKDSTQYELKVFDPGFETFLLSQPHPKNFYSNDYYRSWNIQYVSEWNYRYQHPEIYGDFYESRINYDPSIHYGIELNYKLYQYFQYIAKKYGIVLIARRGKEKTNPKYP